MSFSQCGEAAPDDGGVHPLRGSPPPYVIDLVQTRILIRQASYLRRPLLTESKRFLRVAERNSNYLATQSGNLCADAGQPGQLSPAERSAKVAQKHQNRGLLSPELRQMYSPPNAIQGPTVA